MSNHTSLSVRLAAAAATSAAALLMSVSPASAQTGPEPNYVGPATFFMVSSPQPADPPVDVRQLGAGALAGLAVGAGAVLVARTSRRPHAHATA